MNDVTRPVFVSERITPAPGSADVSALSHGEPGVPRAFTWRGQRYEVLRQRGSSRDMGSDRGDVYVRRHYYGLETTDQLLMTVYFERNPSDRSKRKAWWLYTVAFPEPVILTRRLRLRRWTYADRTDFGAMVSDEKTMRYLHDGVPLSPAQADDALRETIEHYAAGFGDWAIVSRADGAIIGESGLTRLPETGEIELGYMLRHPYWGVGYASEAAHAVAQYAFERLALERIVSMVRPGNNASVHVLEKLGMRELAPTTHRGHAMRKFELRQAARARDADA
ncbi:MAG: GNAT family N-acetyltransferase [Candidatus Eremiobacteraeota bacterium]|nr:GNAT family N-acetyltransferase [Candidatus Eremiobacteraeota bacterium]